MREETTSTASATPAKDALDKFNREKMSRRQAFARIGFTAASAVVAALSADDLMRLSARALERTAADNKITASLASEFHNMGVAFAGGTPTFNCVDESCDGLTCCQCCVKSKVCGLENCTNLYNYCVSHSNLNCENDRISCEQGYRTQYGLCCSSGCSKACNC